MIQFSEGLSFQLLKQRSLHMTSDAYGNSKGLTLRLVSPNVLLHLFQLFSKLFLHHNSLSTYFNFEHRNLHIKAIVIRLFVICKTSLIFCEIPYFSSYLMYYVFGHPYHNPYKQHTGDIRDRFIQQGEQIQSRPQAWITAVIKAESPNRVMDMPRYQQIMVSIEYLCDKNTVASTNYMQGSS